MNESFEIENLRFTRHHVGGGVHLNCATAGDAHENAVLLLHGYSDSWFSFSRVIGALARSYRVIAPDQRGHGDSDRPHDNYSMSAFAEDAVALLDRLGIEKVAVIGHSMSSYVAQVIASRYPERITRLVVAGAAPTLANAGVSELASALEDLPEPVPEAFVRDFQWSTVHQPLPASFMERVVAESGKLPAQVWRAIMTGMLDSPDVADEIRAPTLIIWGEHDAIFSHSEQLRLANGIPDARLHIYSGVGHAPHWEEPRRFVADVCAFLGESTGGGVLPARRSDECVEPA